MKTEELTALGLSDEQVKSVFALNGKDIAALQATNAELTKVKESLTAERDNLSTQLTAANDTLSKFGDLTPESMQAEIQKYKDQVEATKKDFQAQLTARDQSAWIDKKLDEYGVTSPYAKAALKQELMSKDSGLTWKDGVYFGFDDYMKAAKEKDSTLEGKKPEFVAPLGQTKPDGGETKKEIPKVW